MAMINRAGYNKEMLRRKALIIGVLFVFSFSTSALPAKNVYAASSASLYLSPSTGAFYVGSTFDVSILLNTGDIAINTVEVELKFPQDKIQIANPSVGKSLIQIWATNPTFSNREGRVYFVGGIPSPGIKTSQGVILTMTFRVVAPGSGDITFAERTRVLANDGIGTNVLSQATHGSYTFTPTPPQGPEVSSPTHPDQTLYYNNPNPELIWTTGGTADGYSYSFDQDVHGFPNTSVSFSTETSASYNNIADGTWYFHVRAKNHGVWGGTSTFTINIDTTPPAAFDISTSPGVRTTLRNPIVRFFTTDSLSGLDHYQMKIIPLAINTQDASQFFFEVSSPYQFQEFQPGRYTIVVRAYDKAGNWRDEETTLNIVRSFFQFLNSDGVDLVYIFLPWGKLINTLIILLIIIIIMVWFFWRQHRKHKKQLKEAQTKIATIQSRQPPPNV